MDSLLSTSVSLPTKLAATLCVSWALYKLLNVGSREKDLPPGPPTLPLLGNLLSLPTQYMHIKLTEFARQWGEIYSLKLGPGTAIVITSPQAVRELLEVKGASTAGRPSSYIADFITGGVYLGVMPYNDLWRKLRRAIHEVLAAKPSLDFIPIQNAETAQLLNDILSKPEDFYTLIRRYSASVMLSVASGQRIPQPNTPYLTAFFHMSEMWTNILSPGGTPPIDMIPILAYVPEKFAKWKVVAKTIRDLQHHLTFGLLDACETRQKLGERNGCFLEIAQERGDEWGLSKEVVAALIGNFMDAGAESTASFIHAVVLFMTAYPEAQRKAQEELDSVVGSQRRPTLDDLESLPYIRAIIKELHRIRPIAPLAVPHSFSNEEFYKGYRLPKDAMLFINTYGIFHDEALFERPEEFMPERYIDHHLGLRSEAQIDGMSAKTLESLAFGAGRRTCPGLHVAANSAAISTANLLWSFEFFKPKDEHGKDIEPDLWNYIPGLATGPKEFNAVIRPRSAEHVRVIRRGYLDAQSTLEIFEKDIDPADKVWLEESRKLTVEQLAMA